MSATQRHHRQTLVQGWDQEKVSKSTVLIAGIGALGCEAAKNLALMGIGKLILVDNDFIELSNLSRQMLFQDENIGKPKAVTAKKRLSAMCPQVEVEAYVDRIQNLPAEVYERADVIVGGLDSWAARRWLNSVSVSMSKPYVDGGTYALWGNVQVVIPKKTPCLECQGAKLISEEIQEAECTLRRRQPADLFKDIAEEGINDLSPAIAKKLFDAGYKTLYDLKNANEKDLLSVIGCDQKALSAWRNKLKPTAPMLLTVNAVIAAVQAHEGLKIIMEGKMGDPIDNLLIYDSSASTFTIVKLEKNDECIVCSEAFRIAAIQFPADLEETIGDLRNRIANAFGYPDVVLQFKWQILTEDQKTLSESGLDYSDVLYIHSSRANKPKKLVLSK